MHTSLQHHGTQSGADSWVAPLQEDRRLVVVAPYSLVTRNAVAFRAAVLCGLIESTTSVELDLSPTSRFDNSALCMLISLRKRLSNQGVELRLVNPGTHVLTVPEMTRQLFNVVCRRAIRTAPGPNSSTRVDPPGDPEIPVAGVLRPAHDCENLPL
jgi:anti-anti-sigma regulatory factor